MSDTIEEYLNIVYMQKILLIEDDMGIVTPLLQYIVQAGYNPAHCHDGSQAIQLFHDTKPCIVILDLMLPWKNGIEICKEIRNISDVPIIVLSAKESEDDKVKLLELWADDYVSKPFSPRELMARISSILKRVDTRKKAKNGKIITFGNIVVDTKNFLVTIDSQECRLTKTEFSILEYLLKNHDTVIKRESLMKNIIGYDNYVYDRTIDTHVKNIRKKLWDSMTIETIRWIGYKIHRKD